MQVVVATRHKIVQTKKKSNNKCLSCSLIMKGVAFHCWADELAVLYWGNTATPTFPPPGPVVELPHHSRFVTTLYFVSSLFLVLLTVRPLSALSLPSIRYWQEAAGNCVEETACKSLISPWRVSPHILLLLLNLSSHFLLCVFSLLSHLVVHPKCGLTFQRVAPLGVNNETWVRVCVCVRERVWVCVYVHVLFGGMTFLYNGRDFKLKCLSECVFLRIQWLKNTSLESFVLISPASTRQLNKQISTFMKKKVLLWLQRMSGIIGVGMGMGGPFALRSLRASSGLKADFFRIIWISKLTFSAKCFLASLPPTQSVFSC